MDSVLSSKSYQSATRSKSSSSSNNIAISTSNKNIRKFEESTDNNHLNQIRIESESQDEHEGDQAMIGPKERKRQYEKEMKGKK